jgi:hypothetical protein
MDPSLEWRKGSKQLGFPDKEHSFIFGTLYYIIGIDHNRPKTILQVNLIVPRNDQSVGFTKEVSTTSLESGSISKNKSFGNSSIDWFTQEPIQDREDFNQYFQNTAQN